MYTKFAISNVINALNIFIHKKLQKQNSHLHWTGTPAILQARGSEIARVRLMGNWNGTFPVIRRHAQSVPLLRSDLSDPQQSEVGEDPLPVLPVIKLMHGVKLEIIEFVHGVLICP